MKSRKRALCARLRTGVAWAGAKLPRRWPGGCYRSNRRTIQFGRSTRPAHPIAPSPHHAGQQIDGLLRGEIAFGDQDPHADAGDQVLGWSLESSWPQHWWRHGELRLSRDVEAFVLEPSYKGNPIDKQAELVGVPVEWQEGRQLAVSELLRRPPFRWPHVIAVGSRVAFDRLLNARIIGAARNRAEQEPHDLKKAWHHVARHGSPTHSGPS